MTNILSNERSLEATTDRLRRAQKAGRLGTWDWDVTTNELIWDGVEAVHGLPEGSFGGTFEGYLADIHPEDKARVLDAIKEAREHGADLDVEYRIIIPDGSVRWVQGLGTCFRDEAGHTLRMSGTCQDITERKRTELQKEDLFAFASHELRNPLTSILGFSRLLERRLAREDEPLGEDGMEAIRTISAESQRMADILETFLDLARSETRRLELNVEDFDLIEVMDEEVDRMQRKHPQAQIHVVEPEHEVHVNSDVRRLRQVISNLIDNAVKYGGNPPEVWVSFDVEGDWASIRVRDNGNGVSEHDRQQLFGRFYRGSAWSGGRAGLGIGLYLSRQFMQQVGGTLDLESPSGQPAVFLLRLPLATAQFSSR